MDNSLASGKMLRAYRFQIASDRLCAKRADRVV